MHTVLTKAGSQRIILQSGKTVSTLFFREISNDIELPPEPTTCCMTGCTNCVWIAYAETVAKLMHGNTDQARKLILNKIEDPNLKMFLSIELKNIQHNLEQSKNNNTETEKDKLK